MGWGCALFPRRSTLPFWGVLYGQTHRSTCTAKPIALPVLQDDEERYVIKGTGDMVGALDYFTEYEYQTFLLPAIEREPEILDFDVKADTIINIPVQPCHTYNADVAFARFVLQLVNPPYYSMYIINTIVSEMKMDIYRNETADTFRSPVLPSEGPLNHWKLI